MKALYLWDLRHFLSSLHSENLFFVAQLGYPPLRRWTVPARRHCRVNSVDRGIVPVYHWNVVRSVGVLRPVILGLWDTTWCFRPTTGTSSVLRGTTRMFTSV